MRVVALLFALGILACAGMTWSAGLPVPILDARAIEQRCEKALAGGRAEIARMEKRRTGDVLAEWNRLKIGVEDIAWPGALYGMVHTEKAAREAGDKCYAASLELDTEMFQSEALLGRVRRHKALNPTQARMREDLLLGFEEAGVTLGPEKRARVKAIKARLEILRQEFFRAVDADPPTIAFTAEEMRGTSEKLVARLKRDEAGRYLVPMSTNFFSAFINQATDSDARQRAMTGRLRLGGEANMARLDEIVALRSELAALLGASSYAEVVLRRKMARRPETVNDFLARVREAIEAQEKAEIEEIRAAKAKDTGKPLDETVVVRADVPYYIERIRAARQTVAGTPSRIPTAKAIRYMLEVAERLYGIETRALDGPAWHPDVLCYEAIDAQTRKTIGSFCLDLFRREGKYQGAAAMHVFGASRLVNRKPFSALIANENATAISVDDLETIMHEFGHVLHGVLSETDYAAQSGTRVMGDFVEAPSQMFEAWATDPGALSLLRAKCPECTGLEAQDLARLRESSRLGRGLTYFRSWQNSVYDMELASLRPGSATAVWNRLQREAAIADPEGTFRPAQFRHVAGGYAAGFYGYMWSEAIAEDLRSAFGGNLLDASVGRRLRKTVLSQGGQKHPADLVRDFLGREARSDAFFARIR